MILGKIEFRENIELNFLSILQIIPEAPLFKPGPDLFLVQICGPGNLIDLVLLDILLSVEQRLQVGDHMRRKQTPRHTQTLALLTFIHLLLQLFPLQQLAGLLLQHLSLSPQHLLAHKTLLLRLELNATAHFQVYVVELPPLTSIVLVTVQL